MQKGGEEKHWRSGQRTCFGAELLAVWPTLVMESFPHLKSTRLRSVLIPLPLRRHNEAARNLAIPAHRNRTPAHSSFPASGMEGLRL